MLFHYIKWCHRFMICTMQWCHKFVAPWVDDISMTLCHRWGVFPPYMYYVTYNAILRLIVIYCCNFVFLLKLMLPYFTKYMNLMLMIQLCCKLQVMMLIYIRHSFKCIGSKLDTISCVLNSKLMSISGICCSLSWWMADCEKCIIL